MLLLHTDGKQTVMLRLLSAQEIDTIHYWTAVDIALCEHSAVR